jgi:trimeric autotransporter adhesin
MKPLSLQLKKLLPLCLIVFALGSLALLPNAQAVDPPKTPDPPPLPVSNTADGQLALSGVTGTYNSAFGIYACLSNGAANFNTGIGADALLVNTADENTAVGAGTLFSNTIGRFNTANGAFALFSSSEGDDNTAIGDRALLGNTIGGGNTAIGNLALSSNSTGGDNIALGSQAGINITGDNNIDIGNQGDASDSNTIRMGNDSHERILIPAINNIVLGAGVPVTIDSTTGLLGVATSSQRFKENIKPMDKASETILALNPVTFHYKSDKAGTPQFGLIAEDVERINAGLVVRDKEGRPYSVRYDAVNAMLLNEFLKEHRKVEELEANAVRQQKQIDALTAGVEKVSAQLEVSKPAPQTVLNNH